MGGGGAVFPGNGWGLENELLAAAQERRGSHDWRQRQILPAGLPRKRGRARRSSFFHQPPRFPLRSATFVNSVLVLPAAHKSVQNDPPAARHRRFRLALLCCPGQESRLRPPPSQRRVAGNRRRGAMLQLWLAEQSPEAAAIALAPDRSAAFVFLQRRSPEA